MDKKQIASWGVSFGSLALVAGMVSYLGFTNGSKSNNTNKSNQIPAESQQSGQSDGNSFGQSFNSSPSSSFDDGSRSFNGDDSEFDDESQASDNNSSNFFQSNGDSFSNRGSFGGHSRHFDTTTGGT